MEAVMGTRIESIIPTKDIFQEVFGTAEQRAKARAERSAARAEAKKAKLEAKEAKKADKFFNKRLRDELIGSAYKGMCQEKADSWRNTLDELEHQKGTSEDKDDIAIIDDKIKNYKQAKGLNKKEKFGLGLSTAGAISTLASSGYGLSKAALIIPGIGIPVAAALTMVSMALTALGMFISFHKTKKAAPLNDADANLKGSVAREDIEKLLPQIEEFIRKIEQDKVILYRKYLEFKKNKDPEGYKKFLQDYAMQIKSEVNKLFDIDGLGDVFQIDVNEEMAKTIEEDKSQQDKRDEEEQAKKLAETAATQMGGV